MAIVWRKDLEIGVSLIDGQHQELFNRINNLLDACTQGKGKEEIGKTMGFLQEYVVTHFNAEEKLMTQNGYPEYKAHKDQHDKFIKDFLALKDEFDEKGSSTLIVLRTNRTVVSWLMNHISHVDVKLGDFLKQCADA